MGCLSISIRYRQQRQRFQAVVQVMGCLSISTTKTEVKGCVMLVDIDSISTFKTENSGHVDITTYRVSISNQHRVLDIPRDLRCSGRVN